VADAAYAITNTEIQGYHITSAFRDCGQAAIPPYPPRIRVLFVPGRWRAAEQDGVVDNADWKLLPDEASATRLSPNSHRRATDRPT
ncbi:MAG: hypothetical protein AAFY97_03185, partial [Pseudomonadota bacterium]